jgi:RecA/RadA recombinase
VLCRLKSCFPLPQLCLFAAASAAAAGLQVLFIDSTGGFSALRIAQLLQHVAAPPTSNADARRALDTVRVAHAFDVHAALALLDDALRGEREADADGAAADADGPAPSSAPRVRPALLVCDSASALLSPLLTTSHAQGARCVLNARRVVAARL